MYESKYKLLNQLKMKANDSLVEHKLGAVIIKGNKMLTKPCCNLPKNSCYGNTVGSIHAEVNAIITYFGKSFYYNHAYNKVYYGDDYKRTKLDLIVIRINKNGDLCNSRPCYNCLNMMKTIGIRKVYYSISNTEIICENVKDMISIQCSAVSRYIEKCNFKTDYTLDQYYENLLIKIYQKL